MIKSKDYKTIEQIPARELELDSIIFAEEEIEKGNYEFAESILIKLLVKDSQNINALNDLVVVLIIQNKYLDAVAKLNEVLKIDPENEVAISNIKYIHGLVAEVENDRDLNDRTISQYDNHSCPCCSTSKISPYKKVDGSQYFKCVDCGTLFVDTDYLEKIDGGINPVEYRDDYWEFELQASLERSSGIALARMAEVFYYSRIPINKFIDIGTGPGYFLDMISKYLPNNRHIFYANEKYPPLPQYRTTCENYLVGDLSKINHKYDAGMCIEVVEHLTPKMVSNLFSALARISNQQALYIFNTGMPDFVEKEDPSYLDPNHRGHIVSYSVKAMQHLAAPFGFRVMPIPGKTWAFIAEYKSLGPANENIQNRIWTALEQNLKVLSDKEMGSVLKILGLETCRAYGQ